MSNQQFFPLLGFLWIFFWVIFALVAWHLEKTHKQKKIELIHQERMKAMEKGVPLSEVPELDINGKSGRAWQAATANPRWPLGVGALLIMAGLGTSLALYLSGEAYHNEVWPFGLIGVFIGIGLFLHYWLTRRPNA